VLKGAKNWANIVQKKLYKTVCDGIIEKIVAGEYAPGAMLPSEFELADQFEVSQGTARKALIELEQKKIVERRQGKGTFVTLRTPENSLFHFFRLRDEQSEQVVPELIDEKVVRRSASQKEQAQLHGSPIEVFEIMRVRAFNSTPLCVETSVVPCALFPGLIDRAPLPNTLYVLFQQAYGCAIIHAEENLSAGKAGYLASSLSIDEDVPVLIAHRRAFDLLDRVVEIRHGVYRTDNAQYNVHLD
jgi:GntR family transcriptional regulator